MKRIGFISLAVITCFALSAGAVVNIHWGSIGATSGFQSMVGSWPANALPIGSLVHLYYTGTDGLIDALPAQMNSITQVAGDDEFLVASTIGTGSGSAGLFQYSNANGEYSMADAYGAQNVYMRVFDTTTGAPGSTYDYFTSAGVTASAPPSPGTVLDAGAGIHVMDSQVEIVPEPGTLALFCIGLITAGLRKVRRRRA